ncbi:MAG: glycosyltransferase family 2 protein [Rhodospirillaceae bacterium]|jgi:glucosyl-dolichyl phosphate glucuronosyltransferase|nr:glycosyltransferase family 2 protein [Rhodospirillaceae bacterium]MBT4588659.1 glycosyltransferase family 2 protein [Rhodospirillaceae bacterium]MBT4940910.1 glycosyltransferase family 2 protein [Rhodospirillaceae bacterium]MBT5939894.1 glycosyltransferase family 2 protein [Rhodospirillaceae bacterium]MBT7265384.1 glycosyltransferase family 2 protein [Rhodospirillaceae bacterium]
MNISVTITTVNRADRLVSGLEALLAQDFPKSDFEVIVADNGSTDPTKDVCDDYASKFENFTYLYDARPGQMVGWHRALKIAQGDITCFIDDDVSPDSSWLAGVAGAYRDSEVGLATGPIKLHYETPPPDWIQHMIIGEPGAQTLPAFGLLDSGSEVKEIPGNFVWGTNFTVRKSCLLEVQGFHPCAMPGRLLKFHGDGEVHVGRSVEALGHRVLYHPEASVVHHIPTARLTLGAIKSKFITTGYTRSFALLRQLRDVYELPGEEEFQAMALRYFPKPDTVPEELIQTIQDGLTFGVSHHLKCFAEDAAFREWVLHDNYLDLDKCYVHPELLDSGALQDETDWRSGQ